MIEVRALLHAHLKNTLREHEHYGFIAPSQAITFGAEAPGVYFQQAPDTAEMPYLVYTFPGIHSDGEGYQLVTLDIDGWDAPPRGDTTPLENLMRETNAALDKRTLAGATLAVTFYLDRKIPLVDEDPRIQRRKYVYQGRLFERGD